MAKGAKKKSNKKPASNGDAPKVTKQTVKNSNNRPRSKRMKAGDTKIIKVKSTGAEYRLIKLKDGRRG